MIFDSDLLYRDLRKHMHKNSKTQKTLVKEIGVARSTFWRLSKNKDITMQTFLKLISSINNDVSRYIKHSL